MSKLKTIGKPKDYIGIGETGNKHSISGADVYETDLSQFCINDIIGDPMVIIPRGDEQLFVTHPEHKEIHLDPKVQVVTGVINVTLEGIWERESD
jgi:hypothetical protein